MTIQGGRPLRFIRPNLPDDEETLGCHRGSFEALNVRNPQRGVRYFYQRKDPSCILRSLNKGAKVVTSDDPEGWGADLPESVGLQLDGVHAFHDVVLMKIPLDKYRQLKAERLERRRAALEANYLAFKERERERLQSLHYHQRPDGRELYYKHSSHGVQIEDIPNR